MLNFKGSREPSRASFCDEVNDGERVARNLTSKPPISGAQLRAARALLKWSVRKLSDQCHLSQSAIARSEQVNGTPPMRVQNLTAIRRVFEEHGIEFLGLDGVRLLPGSSKN
jgi:hypothetical protein